MALRNEVQTEADFGETLAAGGTQCSVRKGESSHECSRWVAPARTLPNAHRNDLASVFRCKRDSGPCRYRNFNCMEGGASLRAGAIPVRACGDAGSGGRIRIRLFSCFAGSAGGRNRRAEEFIIAAWSDFARLTSAVAIIITWICWAAIIVKHFRGMVLSLKQMPSMVNVFVLGTLTTRPDLCAIGARVAAALMTMTVVASEEYLVQTMEQMGPSPATGWR